MAITTTVGTTTLCPASTTTNIVFDAGVAPKAIVVCVAAGGNRWPTTGVTWNGVALTRKAIATYATLGDMVSEVWVSDGFTPAAGSNTLAVTAAGEVYATPYALASAAPVRYTSNFQYSGDVGAHTVSFDSGFDEAVIFIAHASNGSTALTSPSAGFTEDHQLLHGGDVTVHGHEDPSVTGNRTVGWTAGGNPKNVMSAVLMSEGEVILTPTTVGITMSFIAPTIAASGDVSVSGSRLRRIRMSFISGLRLGTTAKRQVALVGGGIETPEMTTGGSEGDLLMQHADQPPTWELPDAHVHNRRWVPAVFRPDPVGSPDDWQLLHADDGSVVMTWIED